MSCHRVPTAVQEKGAVWIPLKVLPVGKSVANLVVRKQLVVREWYGGKFLTLFPTGNNSYNY